jgi:signal peptide peptidase SppA
MTRHRYERQGMLAIEPKAFLGLFDSHQETEPQVIGDAAIVEVRGPLDHHSGLFDSYDAIRERCARACEMPASVVVLKIDSPGGDVSGCFEVAREIRRLCATKGKTLIAYANGQACSGAYALACAASQIVVPATGFVGSVGVINTRVDVTAYDAKEGFRFALTTSGERKGDGHPHKPLSEGESAATQTIVDSLAEVFFDLVADLRGIPLAQVAALQAGVFHGKTAVEAGLADQVMSFDDLLEAINSGAFRAAKETSMATTKEETRATLAALVKAGGADAAWATRALKAMDEEECKEHECEDDPPPEKKDDEEAREHCEDEEEPKEEEAEGDEEEPKAASATARAFATVDTLAKRVAKLESENQAKAVNAFLATRTDLAAETIKLLRGEPLAKVKAIVNSIPKPKVPAAAAAQQMSGTRGAGQGGIDMAPSVMGVSNTSGRGGEIAAIMGLTPKTKLGVKNDGHKMILGADVPSGKDGE